MKLKYYITWLLSFKAFYGYASDALLILTLVGTYLLIPYAFVTGISTLIYLLEIRVRLLILMIRTDRALFCFFVAIEKNQDRRRHPGVICDTGTVAASGKALQLRFRRLRFSSFRSQFDSSHFRATPTTASSRR